MKKRLLSSLLILLSATVLSSCGKYTFEDTYRYPCQDPANFGTPDCEPPICSATETCTKDILPNLNQDGETSP
jgi:hypothetical protein